MIEASEIERVITKLEKEVVKNKIESYKDASTATSAYYEGIVVGLKMSIAILKELLPK